MKELSVEDKAERYNEAIKVAKSKIKNDKNHVLYEDDVIEIFPELKESKDERIKKDIIAILHLYFGKPLDDEAKEMIAWVKKQEQTFTKKDIDDAYLKGICDAKQELENQGNKVKPIEGFNTEFEKQVSCLIASVINKEYEYTEDFIKYVSNTLLNYAKHEIDKQGDITKLTEEERNKFVKGVLTSCALSFVNYLDSHKYEGKMCVSNGECKDIENAFHNDMWDKLHRYYCKYIKKQDESKFNVDDWVVNKFGNVWHIDRFDKGIYEVSNNNGYNFFPMSKQDEMRLWTIQDAKDGDVLISSSAKPFIYNGKFIEIYVGGYCGLDIYGNFAVGKKECNWTYNKYIKPATKEQSDLLFQKMKEARYEWDAERKVLYQDLKKLMKNMEEKRGTKDLEEIINKEYLKLRHYGSRGDNMLVILNKLQFEDIAKYFFELGLKAKKRE